MTSLSVACLFLASLVHAQPRRLTAAPRGTANIVVDGVLDEEAWTSANGSNDFVERVPYPGRIPPVGTSVRVVFDEDALYVGVTMELAEGEVPRALERTRDTFSIFDDDAITIKIDPRLDRRTTLGFAVNAANAQTDYLSIDNGTFVRVEHDAAWESAVHVGERSWSIEVRLPAAALGLSDDEGGRTFGFQISRDHNARAATYDWSPMPPEFGPFSALHYGEVVGVRLGGGTPLVLQPYAIGRYESRDDEGDEDQLSGSVGGEALLRLGEDVWAQLSVLTDFAQVDLDDARVNLDRFPLFYPERRPFFLTGLDVFEFGLEGLSQPFFSRRIGLDQNGRRVTVLSGLKIYGREGPVGFGALDVLTIDDGVIGNYTALRTRVAIDDAASYVGAIFASRQPFTIDERPPGEEDDATHASVGADARLRLLDDRLSIYGFAVGTTREGTRDDGSGEGMSAALRAEYFGENTQPNLSLLYVGDDFDPDVGFVRRRGATRVFLEIPLMARPEGIGLRRAGIWFSGELQHTTDFEQELYRVGSIDVQLDHDSGGYVGMAGRYVEDTVTEGFEAYPGAFVEAGTYRGVQAELWLQTPQARNPVGYAEYRITNAYFGGVQHAIELSFDARIGPLFHLYLEPSAYHVRLRDIDPFWTYAVNGYLRITPLTTLVIDLIARLNDEDKTATGMLRVRYRYATGSDVFLVYREDIDYENGLESERSIALKIAHRFDLLL